MRNYIPEQLAMFLWSVLLGGVLALVYDLFRTVRGELLRRPGPASAALSGALDALYCLLAAASVFFLFMAGDGELRIFILLGVLGGAVLFFCLLSQLLRPLWGFWLGIFLTPLWVLHRFLKKLHQICKKLFSFLKTWFTIICTNCSAYWTGRFQEGDEEDGQKGEGREEASQQ